MFSLESRLAQTSEFKEALLHATSPLEFARGQHAGHHGGEDVEAGRVSGGEADDQRLALVPVGDALRLRDGVEGVGTAVGLAEACKMMQV